MVLDVTLIHTLRLASAGLLTFILLGASVRSFLEDNLSVIQRAGANPFQSYDSKVDYRWAEFSRFMRYIVDRTPDDAIVMFPTGGKSGPTISRSSLAGYFLYPREVVSGDAALVATRPITHVVTADGAPSFPIAGTRSVFLPGRITDETVRPLKGQRDIRLTIFRMRLVDELGAELSALEFADATSPISRRTGGRAARTIRAHSVVSTSDGIGEYFDFQYREPTDYDVWRLPIELESRAGRRTDLELVYSLRDPGVSLTLEPAQSGGLLTVLEPLFADDSGRAQTLRIQDVYRRFQERQEFSRGGSLPTRIQYEARLLFTPGVEAVYPDVGLIEVTRTGQLP
ncbi:MAG: hypothetical protein ACKVVP_11225 [Chloroflexota bacterium]